MTLSPSSRPSNSERRTHLSTQTSSPVCNSTPSAPNWPAHAKPPSREFKGHLRFANGSSPRHRDSTSRPCSTRTSRRLSASTFQLSSEGPCSASKHPEMPSSRPSLVRSAPEPCPLQSKGLHLNPVLEERQDDILDSDLLQFQEIPSTVHGIFHGNIPEDDSTSGHMDHKETDTEPMATSVARRRRTASITPPH